MVLSEVRCLVLDWGAIWVSSDFNEKHMQEDIAHLGLDSVDVVEFCEHLRKELGIEVDFDWFMEFKTLNNLVDYIVVGLSR